MKTLLVVKAAVEVLAGVAFALFPSALFTLLLGTPLDVPGAYAFRMFGTAIIAIGLACWLVRNESEGPAARGLIMVTLLYDVAFVTILLAAHLSAGLSGIAMWPVVVLHLGLAISSLFCLRPGSVVRTG